MIPVLRRQKQEGDLYESEASLVYRASCSTTRATWKNSVVKNKTKNTMKNKSILSTTFLNPFGFGTAKVGLEPTTLSPSSRILDSKALIIMLGL